MMKKYAVCAAAAVVLVAGVLTARNLYREYNPAGAPDPSDMLVLREDGTDVMAVIADDEVPLAAGPGGPGGSGEEGAAAPAENPYIQQVVELVNAERANAGLPPLNKSPEICTAAGVRAQEIASSFSHTRPDGRRYRTVLSDYGISSHSSGENIAGGYRSPQEVVQAWMGSEGHRANILNPDYTNIGVGYYVSGSMQYWSQLFTY